MIPDHSELPDLAGTLDPAAHLGAAIVRRQAAESRFLQSRSWDDWGDYADARAAEQATAVAFGLARREQPDPNLEDDFVVDDEPIWGLW